MKDGFDVDAFMVYLSLRFPHIFNPDGETYTRDLVENLIGYGFKYEHRGKDRFCEFLATLLPEIEFGEVAAFMDDENLTASYGIAEKRRVVEGAVLEAAAGSHEAAIK